jgi:hypothetical protein
MSDSLVRTEGSPGVRGPEASTTEPLCRRARWLTGKDARPEAKSAGPLLLRCDTARKGRVLHRSPRRLQPSSKTAAGEARLTVMRRYQRPRGRLNRLRFGSPWWVAMPEARPVAHRCARSQAGLMDGARAREGAPRPQTRPHTNVHDDHADRQEKEGSKGTKTAAESTEKWHYAADQPSGSQDGQRSGVPTDSHTGPE